MTRILFVCHGNICRSPMAEFMLKDMACRAGIADELAVESAATSSEELGNPVYPPARRKLAEHGIDCEGKTARRIVPEDYERFDLIIGMDEANLRNMLRCFGGDPDRKLHRMLEYARREEDTIPDPWYTGDFDETWDDLFEGCMGLMNELHPEVTLDFSACRERTELYDELCRRMLWQPWYGRNLDALNDMLTGLPYLGRSFVIKLPAADAPCFNYARCIAQEFAINGIPAEIL